MSRLCKVLMTSVVSLAALSGWADVVFTNVVQQYISTDTVYVAQTPKQVAFPDDVGTPIFWLDCADTNGWSITAEGGVLKLPSKVPGSTRYLTSDKNDPNFDNFSWQCYGYPNQYALRNPVWVEAPVLTSPADGLAGCGVLDFGEQGSRRALLFDLWSPDDSCTASNVLANIGSVFAVYDSANGGGCFLGGGGIGGGFGYGWHRGGNRVDGGNIHSYSDSIFLSPHAMSPVYNGMMRHSGVPAPAKMVGFSGGWEALTFCPGSGSVALNATAIGGGDMRPAAIPENYYIFSGGMRIAEMIFFGETLSDEKILKVEAYLRSKWLTKPSGWNGNAVLSAVSADSVTDVPGANGVKIAVNAAEGETASIQTVSGGHFDSSFVKNGAGTLAFGSAPNFNTPIEVAGGTVSFTRRAVPSDVPGRYVFRLDAKRTDLVTKDAENNVSRVDNCGGHQFGGNDIYLTAPYAQPKFVPDALGEGKPIFDLGAVSDSGAFLKFTTNANVSADIKVPGVCALVAVVGAQNGGGSLAASRSLRRGNPIDSFKSPLLTDDGGDYRKVYVDGILRNPASGYPTPGYHVVAIQSASADSDGMLGFGAKLAKDGCGGLRIAEAVVYDRILSDEEIKDASAYLMNKWFGRVPGDYQNPSAAAGSVDVQKLKLSNGSSVDVPEGGVARVGRLDIEVPAVKTGKGTLRIQSSSSAASLLTVQEGSVVFEPSPDVSSADEMAEGASFRLDASDAGSLETMQEGGTNFVLRWYSPGWANLAYSVAGRRPWIDATETLNGKPTVSFGDAGDRYYVGNYMVFGKALRSIRSAYVVWRPHNAASYILGTSRVSDGGARASYDFVSGNGLLFRNNLFSSIFTNGVESSRSTLSVRVNEWVLVEAHSRADDSGGLSASALCAERDNGTYGMSSYGGADYAEVVLFERELSDREKVATRNYLLKKWLPSVDRSELPAAPETKESSVSAMDVYGEIGQSVLAGETLAVGRLVGDGVLDKSGEGTLAVRDLAEFSGTVDVEAGVLKLTGEAPAATEPVSDGLVYHADATWGVTTEIAADGAKKVVEWKSKLDNGWSAVPPIPWGDSKPRYIENALNGRPVVDLAVPTDTNVLQCLRFRQNGADARLTGLRTVIWVFGSQNGGGYILGGGAANNDGISGREWMRGVPLNQIPIRRPTLNDSILYGVADKAARWGAWHVNGVLQSVDPDKEGGRWLSGDWDLLAWDTKTSTRLATADGFGFDGTIVDGSEWADNNGWRMTGQQRLAEVLFYTKTLSDAERTSTESYLKAKWGLLGTRSAVTNEAAVVLAGGASLDMDGKDQYLAMLGGTGSVVNGSGAELTLGSISFDCSSDDCLSIASTVVIEDGFTVHFENFPADGFGRSWKIADVSGYDRRSESALIRVTGIGGNAKARLHYRDGGLYLEISKGYMLILR